jgi:hypothetical protein
MVASTGPVGEALWNSRAPRFVSKQLIIYGGGSRQEMPLGFVRLVYFHPVIALRLPQGVSIRGCWRLRQRGSSVLSTGCSEEARPSLFGSGCSTEACDQQQSQSNIAASPRVDDLLQTELGQPPSSEKSNPAACPPPHALTVHQTEGDKSGKAGEGGVFGTVETEPKPVVPWPQPGDTLLLGWGGSDFHGIPTWGGL